MGPPGGAPGPALRNPNAGGAVVATLPPSQTPRDEYDLAYGYVLRKDYALAEESFRSFLSRYPGDRMTGDATYWLGESLFQRQRYRDAAEAFLNVSTKYEATRQGAGRAAAAWTVACRARREGSRLRLARRGPAQVSACIGRCEAGCRARTEACPLLTMRRRSPPPRRRRCLIRSQVLPLLSSRSPAVPIPPRCCSWRRAGGRRARPAQGCSPSPSITAFGANPPAKRAR